VRREKRERRDREQHSQYAHEPTRQSGKGVVALREAQTERPFRVSVNGRWKDCHLVYVLFVSLIFSVSVLARQPGVTQDRLAFGRFDPHPVQRVRDS
jgi:hypothetical protein